MYLRNEDTRSLTSVKLSQILDNFHGKNGFTERSKILAGYRKVILSYRNNSVKRSN